MLKLLKAALPYYSIAVVWAVYAILFDLYQINHYITVTIISVVVFLIFKALCKEGGYVVRSHKSEELTARAGKEFNLDEVIENCNHSLSEMRLINSRISDSGVSSSINSLETVAEKILQYIRIHPDKLPQIRHFLNEYIPITLRLLTAYDSLNATGISGKNIESSKDLIAQKMNVILSAFEMLLDKLYRSDAMDISSDIAVLENMFAREGLIGEQLEAETIKDNSGVDIKLEI